MNSKAAAICTKSIQDFVFSGSVWFIFPTPDGTNRLCMEIRGTQSPLMSVDRNKPCQDGVGGGTSAVSTGNPQKLLEHRTLLFISSYCCLYNVLEHNLQLFSGKKRFIFNLESTTMHKCI
jgi:hypothetical protein